MKVNWRKFGLRLMQGFFILLGIIGLLLVVYGFVGYFDFGWPIWAPIFGLIMGIINGITIVLGMATLNDLID